MNDEKIMLFDPRMRAGEWKWLYGKPPAGYVYRPQPLDVEPLLSGQEVVEVDGRTVFTA
jgi:hypothetical protein